MSNIFKNLHSKSDFFILGNCWDLLSAKIHENLGYEAIGTSSWAMSSLKGLNDGEQLSFEYLLSTAESIVNAVNIPVSIDIEKGYSDNENKIIENVLKLADIGCSGINIEDSNFDGTLKKSKDFSNLIQNLKNKLDNNNYKDFVINARTDVYLTDHLQVKTDESILRGREYHEAGADCLFIPGLSKINEINEISHKTDIPLNILALPNLTDKKQLAEAGVNRLSFGNSLFDNILSYSEETIMKYLNENKIATVYDHPSLKTNFPI